MSHQNEVIDLASPRARFDEPDTAASQDDCWDMPMASGDLSDLSNMTAGLFGGLDDAFFDNMGMAVPDSLEMPVPAQWDDSMRMAGADPINRIDSMAMPALNPDPWSSKGGGTSSRFSSWDLGALTGVDQRAQSLVMPAMSGGFPGLATSSTPHASGPSSLGGEILDTATYRNNALSAGMFRGASVGVSNGKLELQMQEELQRVKRERDELQMQEELQRVKRERDELEKRLREMEKREAGNAARVQARQDIGATNDFSLPGAQLSLSNFDLPHGPFIPRNLKDLGAKAREAQAATEVHHTHENGGITLHNEAGIASGADAWGALAPGKSWGISRDDGEAEGNAVGSSGSASASKDREAVSQSAASLAKTDSQTEFAKSAGSGGRERKVRGANSMQGASSGDEVACASRVADGAHAGASSLHKAKGGKGVVEPMGGGKSDGAANAAAGKSVKLTESESVVREQAHRQPQSLCDKRRDEDVGSAGRGEENGWSKQLWSMACKLDVVWSGMGWTGGRQADKKHEVDRVQDRENKDKNKQADKERERDKAGTSKGIGGKKSAKGDRVERGKVARQRREAEEVQPEEQEAQKPGQRSLSRLWVGLCQMEQDLGSCIFTVVYFCVYFVLHGPTVRLLIIGLIVVVQLSFHIQYPKSLWEPINKVMDVLSSVFDGTAPEGQGTHRGAGGPSDGEAAQRAAGTRASTDAAAAAQRGRAAAAARRLGGVAPTPVKPRKPSGSAAGNSSLAARMVAWGVFAAACLFLLVTLSDVFVDSRAGRTLLGRTGGIWGADVGMSASNNGKVSPSKTKEADRLCDEAQKAEQRRSWSEVQTKLLSALQLDPNHVCSLYNYGRLLDYVWNNPEKAEQMYRRALNVDPKHVPSLRNLGYFFYHVRRDHASASAMWTRALAENPRELDVLSGFATLEYHVNGDLRRAEKLFKQALAVQPAHPNTLHNYAKMLHYGRRNLGAAETYYRRILEKIPQHMGAMLDLAGLFHEHHEALGVDRKKAIDTAIDLWERVLQVNSGHIDAIFLLARAEHMERGKLNKAERLYKRLLADGQPHVNALVNYAMLLRTQGRLKAAEALYEKLASLWQDVRYAPSLVQYGDLISQTRLAHSHAKTMYQRALGVNPLKTLEVAALPGHRCWLCSNATRDEDLCCAPHKAANYVGEDSVPMWWAAPPAAPRFGP